MHYTHTRSQVQAQISADSGPVMVLFWSYSGPEPGRHMPIQASNSLSY